MEEYTCKKCGEVCEVIWGLKKEYWPDCWCDKCEDYAEGFDKIQNDLSADWMAERIDRARDRAKYEDIDKQRMEDKMLGDL